MLDSIKLLTKYFPIHSAIIFTLAALILFYIFKKTSYKYASIVLSGLAFLTIYKSAKYAAFTLFVTVFVFIICKMMTSTKSQNTRKFLKIFGICISLGLLVAFKYFIKGVTALGISYYTFKFLHVIIDIGRGRIKDVGFFEFLSFIFFYPTFQAGPIDRYQKFVPNVGKMSSLEKSDIDIGTKKIIYGLFKKYIIADKTRLLISTLAPDILLASTPITYATVFLYSIVIYYDFSGYTDIAIGAGRLFGINVPENFNKPYIKRNLTLFWQNWHMTLTSWLREYLFMPLGKSLMKRLKNRPYIINTICQIVTMAAVGIWHGNTLNFLIWGLYHGIGLSLFRIYADSIEKYANDSVKKWMKTSKVWELISTAITFTFVSIGWIFFTYKWDMAQKILLKLIPGI